MFTALRGAPSRSKAVALGLAHSLAVALSGGVTACALDNPAFGESSPGMSTESDGASATETTAATSSASGTGTGTGSSSGFGTSTGGSETTPTSTTNTTTTGAGTGTTGEPADCWGQDLDAWEVESIEDARLGPNPQSARLRGDGLRLYYLADLPARPYWSDRASLDEPFLVGNQFPPWAEPGGAAELTVLAEETEMIFTRNVGMDAAIQVSVLEQGNWSVPTVLSGINTPQAERWSTLNADGSRVIFTRQVGEYNPYLDTEVLGFLEASRAPNAAPGTDFAAPAEIVLPGITDDEYAHPLFCPSLSPDGLTLFFGSSYPLILAPENASGALQIHVVTRDTLGAPWSAPKMLTSLKREGWESCPWSITADGCQMTFQHAKIPSMGEADPVRLMLARRGP